MSTTVRIRDEEEEMLQEITLNMMIPEFIPKLKCQHIRLLCGKTLKSQGSRRIK